ncbi:MAG: rhodanese-like domain-containing protein [Sulfurimonas sp.]|uniref:sulfurtransferase n=1 Tax=Sulfurimonas sp. TaxID=2022749 RepID=UPI0028CDA115|nr:rhodanese-like domain-containing protein [Sulfurimonas sp.]MDT8337993.1 rhodanese-like domain-containing protein [Sulfurimonas sp.]
MKHLLALILLSLYSYAYDAFITPDKLKDSLSDEKIVLLDVSPLDMYSTSHIKGAIHADISKFSKSDYERLASAYSKNVQKEIINLGINPDSHVVIYSRNSYENLQNSTYLAFVLAEHGFENISILEGGYIAWVFKYHTLVSSKRSSAKEDGSYKIKHNPNFLVELDYIKSNSRNITIVDSSNKLQSPELFSDISYTIDRDYRDNFFDDLTLRDEDELREFVSKLSLIKDKDIVVYDETIFEASVNWYILYQKFGFKNIKILHF